MSEQNRDEASRSGDLEGLRDEAAGELDQERAESRARESRAAAVKASRNRAAFEDRQKEQAKADAAEDERRARRIEGDRDQYDRLREAEAEAREQANSDARDAGLPTLEEEEAAAENQPPE